MLGSGKLAVAEVPIAGSQGVADGGFNQGLGEEAGSDIRLGLVEGVSQSHVLADAAGEVFRSRGSQHLGAEKVEHRPGFIGRPTGVSLLGLCLRQVLLGLAFGPGGADGLPRKSRGGRHQHGNERSRRGQGRSVLAGEFPQPVDGRWRARFDGIAGEVPLELAHESAGRFIAALALFLQAFHHHPVEVAAQISISRLGSVCRTAASDGSASRWKAACSVSMALLPG